MHYNVPMATPGDLIPAALRASMTAAVEVAMVRNLDSDDRLAPDALAKFGAAVAGATTAGELGKACGSSIRAGRKVAAGDVAAESGHGTWNNHVDAERFSKFGLNDIAAELGPAALFPVPVGYFRFSTASLRTIWISPFTSGSADEVVTLLGLGFLSQDRWMYRLPIDLEETVELAIPFVLDAQAAWYWRRPPAGFSAPWGLTMDLDSCSAAEPELVAAMEPAAPVRAPLLGKTSRSPSCHCLGAAP